MSEKGSKKGITLANCNSQYSVNFCLGGWM